jgi:hypothetical protein
MKKALQILWVVCATLLTGCAANRTTETDNLGWTDPEPQGGPSLENHRSSGGVAYQPGNSPVTQPGWPKGAPSLQSNNPYQAVPPQPTGY